MPAPDRPPLDAAPADPGAADAPAPGTTIDAAADDAVSAAEALFLRVAAADGPAERAALLAEGSEGDAALRAEVEALLAAHDAAGGVLDRPAAGPLTADSATAGSLTVTGGDATSAAAGDAAEPAAPGGYESLGVIGRGGMGVVLKARDPHLDRVVAVKSLAPEWAAHPTARRRFAREARAAAAVTHPHVVTIHAVEIGEAAPHGPAPYLVMEYVAGRSLRDKLDAEGALETREILRIGSQIARGLAAAHAQGLIHRDVKPGNVLLENGVERVKLTDFGLARAADDATITRTGEIAGTPQFMSPEQADGQPVDARGDLFSLGAVLYAMCTGRPPFRGETPVTVLRKVCDETPRPVTDVNPDVPDWLAEVVERLLEKNPDDRFQTAAEVADLLGRQLADLQNPASRVRRAPAKPVPAKDPAARPAGRLKPWAVAAAALLALALVGGTTEATGVTDVIPTVVRLVRGDGTLVVKTEDPSVAVTVEGEDVLITGAGLSELRLKPGAYAVEAVKDGRPFRQLVTVERNGRAVVDVRWEPGRGAPAAADGPRGEKVIGRLARGGVPPNPVGVTWDAAEDAWKVDGLNGRTVRLFQVALDGAAPRVLTFSADLKAKGVKRRAYLELRVEDGLLSRSRARDAAAAVTGDADWTPAAAELRTSPSDAPRRAEMHLVVDGGGTVWVRDATLSARPFFPADKEFAVPPAAPRAPGQFRFPDAPRAPGGFRFPAVPRTPAAPAAEFTLVRKFTGHAGPVKGVALSPDGKLAASASGWPEGDESVRLWNVADGTQVGLLDHGAANAKAVAFSPDGRSVLTGDDRGGVRLWGTTPGAAARDFEKASDTVNEVAFTPDGKTALAATGEEAGLLVWDVATGKLRGNYPQGLNTYGVAPTPDGKRVAVALQDGSVRLVDLTTGDVVRTFAGPTLKGRPTAFEVAVSPDGKTLAAAYKETVVRLWDLATGTILHDLRTLAWNNERVAFTADSRRLLASGQNGDPSRGHIYRNGLGALCLFDVKTGVRLAAADLPVGGGWAMAASGDGETVLTAGGLVTQYESRPTGDNAVRLWRLTERPAATPPVVRFPSRAGARMELRPKLPRDLGPSAVASRGGTPAGPRLVRPPGESGGGADLSLVRRLEGHTAAVHEVVVSPDGALAASASGWPEGDRTARVWDLSTGRQRHVFPHPGGVFAVAFSPDGSALLTGCVDGNARAFDLSTGKETERYEGADRLLDVTYTPDGSKVVACSTLAAETYVWDAATGELVHRLKEKMQPLKCGVTADGTRVVTADRSGRLWIWNLATGEFLKKIPAEIKHQNASVGLALLPTDADRALSAGVDGVVRLWDLNTGEAAWTADAEMSLQDLAVSPDGRTAVAVGAGRRSLAAIDVATGTVRAARRFEGAGGVIWSAAPTPDGRLLTAHGPRRSNAGDPAPEGDFVVNLWAFSGADAGPRFVRPRVGRPPGGTGDGEITAVRRLRGLVSPPRTVALTPDGRFAAAAAGTAVRMWEVATGRTVETFTDPAAVNSVAFHPDRRVLLTAGEDGVARAHQIGLGPADDHTVRQYRGGDVIEDVTYSPDGSLALAASAYGEKVYVWNAKTADVKFVLTHDRARPSRVAVTPDGGRAVAADSRGRLLVWDLSDGRFLKSLPETSPVRPKTNVGLALSPDGRLAYTGDNTGLTKCWDLEKGEVVWGVTSGVTAVEALAVSPDGTTLLVAGGAGPVVNRSVAVLDAATGAKRLDRAYEGGVLWDAAFLPDGRRFVAAAGPRWGGGDAENAVTLWSLPADAAGSAAAAAEGVERTDAGPGFERPWIKQGTGKTYARTTGIGGGPDDAALSLVRRYEGHAAPATGLAVSPDGARLASASGWADGGDKTARLWDAATGAELARLPHPAGVLDVAFSPDGGSVLTGAYDGIVRLWAPAGELPGAYEVTRTFRGPDVALGVAFTPDGSAVLAVDPNRPAVYVWDAATGAARHVLKYGDAQMLHVAVTGDGKHALAVNRPGQLIAWDLETGDLAAALPEEPPGLAAAAGLAAVGARRAVVGAGDGVLRLWDVPTGELLATLPAELNVEAIAVAPDGRTGVAVGGSGQPGARALTLFDLKEKRVRLGRTYGGGLLWDAAFLPDGDLLVTSGSRWERKGRGPVAVPAGPTDVSRWTLPPTDREDADEAAAAAAPAEVDAELSADPAAEAKPFYDGPPAEAADEDAVAAAE